MLSEAEIAQKIKDNVPSGALADKWTNETLKCPSCGNKALDKFTGGPNVEGGNVDYTDFIYHCRVCNINLTEEKYKNYA